jgi:type I restriction enzyme M protein
MLGTNESSSSNVKAMTIREIENRLWSAADQLWANTGLRPSQFSTPVLGLIFLRYAEKRFVDMQAILKKEGIDPKKADKYDYQERGVLYLPKKALFSYLLTLPEGENLGRAVNEAMAAVESENEELKGVLPRNYTVLPNATLVELLRLLAPLDLEGDAFGKIYEYFLGAFAMTVQHLARIMQHRLADVV